VIVHSVNCCLGLFPTISLQNQQTMFNRLSAQSSRRPKSQKKKMSKVSNLAVASVTIMVEEGIYYGLDEINGG